MCRGGFSYGAGSYGAISAGYARFATDYARVRVGYARVQTGYGAISATYARFGTLAPSACIVSQPSNKGIKQEKALQCLADPTMQQNENRRWSGCYLKSKR